MKPLTTLARLALLVLVLAAIGCGDNGQDAATCSPCADRVSMACTGTLADCMAAGDGVCHTGALASLDLHQDGTYADYFPSGGIVSGTWTRAGDTLTLEVPGGSPNTVTVYENGAVCPAGGAQ